MDFGLVCVGALLIWTWNFSSFKLKSTLNGISEGLVCVDCNADPKQIIIPMMAAFAFKFLGEPKYKEFGDQSVFWVIITFNRVLNAADFAPREVHLAAL